MKNLILYAPPAAGKGTLCEYLVSKYNYSVVSIGQVLRNARSLDTEVGKIIIESQDKGVLTPDNIVIEALKNELKKYEDTKVIIEGYPRSIEQAKLLDTMFNDYIVINLSVDKEFAKKRTLGRRSCSKCGKIYNIYFEKMHPKNDGLCDICGVKLDGRSDDNEQSFNVRFGVYEENSKAILDYYRNKNILYIVDANKDTYYTNDQVTQILGE